MHSVRFTTETSSNGVLERDFIAGEVPGVLWSPVSGSDHAPLVLMGHGGGLHKKTPALMARAHDIVTTRGFTVAAIDAPGHGDRPRTAEDEQARAELRQAQTAGDNERFQSVSVRYVTSLAERAVPEWQATLDALQKLPEIGTEAPVGYGGGITLGTAIGVPLTSALTLFDAFASKQKTLHANPGDHRTIRWVGVDNEFLARHLGQRNPDQRG